MGPQHFPETSFHRIVVSPKCNFAESLFCRKKIAESHLTESSHGRIVGAKLYNAEWHFFELLFSRTSFSRIIVQPNVIFTNLRSAERRFPETSFARTSFCEIVWSKTSFHRTLNRPPAYTFVRCVCRRAAIEDMRN